MEKLSRWSELSSAGFRSMPNSEAPGFVDRRVRTRPSTSRTRGFEGRLAGSFAFAVGWAPLAAFQYRTRMDCVSRPRPTCPKHGRRRRRSVSRTGRRSGRAASTPCPAHGGARRCRGRAPRIAHPNLSRPPGTPLSSGGAVYGLGAPDRDAGCARPSAEPTPAARPRTCGGASIDGAERRPARPLGSPSSARNTASQAADRPRPQGGGRIDYARDRRCHELLGWLGRTTAGARASHPPHAVGNMRASPHRRKMAA